MGNRWLVGLVLAFVMLAVPAVASGADIRVVLDGQELTFDVPPMIENGRTLVPMRAIFAALGATISWDPDTQTVTAIKGDIAIAIQIGNPYANKNGTGIPLDVPPKIVNGRTLVPLRFVSEALGCTVAWDPATRTATITSAPVIPSAIATGDARLVGIWSTVPGTPAADIVNPVTGVIQAPAYTIFLYDFKADGTYRLVGVGSGQFISGSVTNVGRYRVAGDKVTCYDRKESWRPMPGVSGQKPAFDDRPMADETLTFTFTAEGNLLLDSDTYYPVKR